MANFTLPTVRNKPSNLWERQTFLTYGGVKFGKSELWSEDAEPLFISTEGGLDFLTPYVVNVRSWQAFETVVDTLIKEHAEKKKLLYTSISLDTIDKLYDYACDYEVELARTRYKKEVADQINTIGEIPEGAGWFRVANLLKNKVDKLANLPVAINLIGHTKTIRGTDRESINIPGQAGRSILHWANHIIYCQVIKTNRYLRCRPSETWEAGSRGLALPDVITLENGKRNDPKAIKEAARANFKAIRECFT